jgi:hypothetical protein
MFWDLGSVALDSKNLVLTKDLNFSYQNSSECSFERTLRKDCFEFEAQGQLRSACVLQEYKPCGRVEDTESSPSSKTSSSFRPPLRAARTGDLLLPHVHKVLKITELGSEANKVQREEQRKIDEAEALSDEEIGEQA